MPPSTFTNWYAQIPGMVLTCLIYLMLARLVLSMFLAPHATVMRLLRKLTDPVVVPTRAITPRLVPGPAVIVLGIIWVFVVRMIVGVVAPATG